MSRVYWTQGKEYGMFSAEVDDDAVELGIGVPCPHHGTQSEVDCIVWDRDYTCAVRKYIERPGYKQYDKLERLAVHPFPAKHYRVQGGGNYDTLVVTEAGKTKEIKGVKV